MAKFDDASWHYDGDFPSDLQPENGATHIGMFLTWCIDNDLLSEELIEDAEEEIGQVKNREITGAEFLIKVCDEKFTDDDLNDEAIEFALDYYEDDTDFGQKYNSYTEDYGNVFDKYADEKGFEYKSFYHVEDTFDNYNLLKSTIDTRFEQWKEYRK